MSLCARACLPLLLASGCSFVFTEPPPRNHERLWFFTCGSSWAPPVLDVVLTGVYTVNAVRLRNSREPNRGQRVGTAAALGGVAAASAIYGVVTVSRCDEATAQLQHRLDPRLPPVATSGSPLVDGPRSVSP